MHNEPAFPQRVFFLFFFARTPALRIEFLIRFPPFAASAAAAGDAVSATATPDGIILRSPTAHRGAPAVDD